MAEPHRLRVVRALPLCTLRWRQRVRECAAHARLGGVRFEPVTHGQTTPPCPAGHELQRHNIASARTPGAHTQTSARRRPAA